MTSTEFAAKYRILRSVAEDGVRTFTAQHVATQRPVMVHFLDAGASPAPDDLLARTERLDATDRARILERVEVDGTMVVVTQVLASFESLPSWLQARGGAARPHLPPPAPESKAPGEFTSLFAPPVAPAPVAPEPQVPEPQVPEPGEFTRFFRQAGAAPSAPAPLRMPPLARPVAPAPIAPPPSPPPVRPASPISGSATGALDARPLPPVQRPAAIPDPVPPKSSGVPLDFPPPLPPSQTLPSSAPAAPERAPFPPAMPQLHGDPAAPPPLRSVGPSEFTRVIAGPVSPAATPAPAAAPAQAAPEPAAEPKGSGRLPLVPLLLALNVIVLATIALVLYFALKD